MPLFPEPRSTGLEQRHTKPRVLSTHASSRDPRAASCTDPNAVQTDNDAKASAHRADALFRKLPSA